LGKEIDVDYLDLLERIINDGIDAAKKDYAADSPKLKGSIAGFEACRGKYTLELAIVLEKARKVTVEAYSKRVENYWEIRCFEAEVEWVANCVSASNLNMGFPVIVNPTARGMMKVAEILGVSNESKERNVSTVSAD
jgi:hypothetical protein